MWFKFFIFCVFLTYISAQEAVHCDFNKCKLPNCLCSGSTPNIVGKIPQFVVLSFDDSASKLISNEFYEKDLFTRKNPDGCPISGTFFVPHEYTDYSVVNNLYNRGFEIGSHSVTKNYSTEYWKKASENLIKDEMGNQKIIISKFANIPAKSILGARIPHFQMNGDDSISGIKAAGFQYDNSWSSLSKYPLFPYTLDYSSSQTCPVGTCPKKSHPGFWVVPINDWKGMDNQECNKVLGCVVEGNGKEIFNWMLTNFNRNYKESRAPVSLVINYAWFTFTENSLEALRLFLDHIKTLKDVYVISNKQLLNWIKAPTPVGKFSSCQSKINHADCKPVNCKLKNEDNQDRYMGSCVLCPPKYPSLHNPEGKK